MRLTRGLLLLTALAAAVAPAAAGEKGKKGALDPARLAGTWVYVSGEKDGKKLSADELKKGFVEISKEAIKLKSPDGEFVLRYTLDVTKKPARIELEIVKGPHARGQVLTPPRMMKAHGPADSPAILRVAHLAL